VVEARTLDENPSPDFNFLLTAFEEISFLLAAFRAPAFWAFAVMEREVI
jgi:hypothetical protein